MAESFCGDHDEGPQKRSGGSDFPFCEFHAIRARDFYCLRGKSGGLVNREKTHRKRFGVFPMGCLTHSEGYRNPGF